MPTEGEKRHPRLERVLRLAVVTGTPHMGRLGVLPWSI